MKLTLSTIMNTKEALTGLGNATGLQSVIAYRILKNIKAINKEIDNYEKTAQKLVKEKAKKDENGEPVTNDQGQFQFEDGVIDELNKELNTLSQEEVELDIKTVSLSDIDNAGLSSFQLETIEFMLEDE